MFKHNSHPRRSRRDAVDITSDLSEHPDVRIPYFQLPAAIICAVIRYTLIFEEVYSPVSLYVLAILPRFRSFGLISK